MKRRHIQGAITIKCGTTPDAVRMLVDHVKVECALGRGSGSNVVIKPLRGNQTFMALCGYCQKDVGKPHYRQFTKNLTPEFLRQAVEEYGKVSLNYEDGKTLLTKNNFMQQTYSFVIKNLDPLRPPLPAVLMWMLQTGEFMLAAHWFITGQGMPLDWARTEVGLAPAAGHHA
jgi:hypothetical protein